MEKERITNYKEIVKEQILAIRNSGLTNMFDAKAVQRLADEREFFELVCFIEDQPNQYINFIISGDESLLPE